MNTLINTRNMMYRWTNQLAKYASDVKKRSDEVNTLGVKAFIKSDIGK